MPDGRLGGRTKCGATFVANMMIDDAFKLEMVGGSDLEALGSNPSFRCHHSNVDGDLVVVFDKKLKGIVQSLTYKIFGHIESNVFDKKLKASHSQGGKAGSRIQFLSHKI